jgi:hypothetical protein
MSAARGSPSNPVRQTRHGWLARHRDFSSAVERRSEPADPIDAGYRNVHRALSVFLARSSDNHSDYASMLPQLLAGLGLAGVGGEGRLVFGCGGSAAARVIEAGLRQVGDQMIRRSFRLG